jgi:hypothetical protein
MVVQNHTGTNTAMHFDVVEEQRHYRVDLVAVDIDFGWRWWLLFTSNNNQ